MSIISRVLRAGEGKKVRAVQALVPEINAFEPEMQRLSDDALKAKTPEFRQRLANGALVDDLLIEAFAVTREAARRVIGQRHYDVQLMGGVALHFGWVAEMRTGEGKTLVSTLPVYLNGLTSRGVHLVTVNDYLARRDAEWMGAIHRWLGLSLGLIIPAVEGTEARRAAYNCDVTYATNSELGFDYLRDNMAMSMDERVQREYVYAIVDEVDSILIDEARTPHIISGRVADSAKLYVQFAAVVRSLVKGRDYELEEDKRIVVPTEEGIERVEAALGIDNLYDDPSANYVHHLNAALKAKELYKRDVEYLIQNDEVVIVDEYTGRLLEGRRWSEGIHQAVEAKERVKIKEENQTLATTTLQNFFRMYEKLAGMTGTAETEAGEFATTYNLSVVPIPTHRPMIRADQPDLVFKTEDAKFEAVVEDLAGRFEAGQPVLVGTVSVEKSERLSRQLQLRGIPHAVLNAKHHAQEAEIVAQAGRLHAITVATNMAGRGVDIILGGNPDGLTRRELAARGHDPGLLDLDPAVSADAIRLADPAVIEAKAAAQALFDQLRPQFVAQCSNEGEKVKALGGCYVLATERHESRRIDNQLRGRSGRQGDPGESRFYLSLEDDLMRMFATGAMNWVMGKTLPDDVPIEAKMVTKAIERAQTTVEARNAETRKNVLKYDEVMNAQRKVIYARRDEIMEGGNLRDYSLSRLHAAIEGCVETHCASEYLEEWDLEALTNSAREYYPTKFTTDELKAAGTKEVLVESLATEAEEHYAGREAEIGPDLLREVERNVLLSIVDQRWREHLQDMDYLQEGINLRAMGQKDPLVEWQREGYDMFGQMIAGIDDDFVRYIMHVDVLVEPASAPEITNLELHAADESDIGRITPGTDMGALFAATAADGSSSAPMAEPELAPGPIQPLVRSPQEKLGRNESCYCGSAKKYKNCHGK